MAIEVSVCIPAYNNVASVERCLRSVIAQESVRIEIIITDDSTNDDVERAVKKLGDPRVVYFRNTPALGSPGNWNEGISKAIGDWVKILHHDDWFSTHTALRTMVDLAESSEVDWLFCGCKNIDGHRIRLHNIDEHRLKRLVKTPSRIVFSNIIGAPSVTLVRRTVLGTEPFDISTKWVVDQLFYYDLLNVGKRFKCLNTPLISITTSHPGQITQTMHGEAKFLEILYAIQKTNMLQMGSRLRFWAKLLIIEKSLRYRTTIPPTTEADLATHFTPNCLARLRAWSKLPRFSYFIFAMIRRLKFG